MKDMGYLIVNFILMLPMLLCMHFLPNIIFGSRVIVIVISSSALPLHSFLDLLLMMFHVFSLHWSLIIICIPDKEDESGPIILHLDSLSLHSSRSLFDNIRR